MVIEIIHIKNSRELELMKEACVIAARALQLGGKAVCPGVTTAEIDREIRRYIGQGQTLLSVVRRFPGAACISINGIIHGIPDKQSLKKATFKH